jgi:hypothetical protein
MANSWQPDKARVVFSKKSIVELHYRNVTDSPHVSFAGTVSLSGKSLKHFLLPVSKI